MNSTDARAEVRLLLGDPTGGIYSDDQIDAAASTAYHRVRNLHPEPITITASPAAGDRTVNLSVDVISVLSVSTGKWSVEPGTERDLTNPAHDGALLTYTADANQLNLSRAIHQREAGTWTIRATWIPDLPAGPTDDWDLPTSLDSAVIYFVAADLLKTRAAQTQRRGSKSDFSHNQQIETYTREARRICSSYRKVARMT